MQASLKLSAPAFALLAALDLAGCSTASEPTHQAFVPATQIEPPTKETQTTIQPMREVAEEDEEGDPYSNKLYRGPDGDDYQAMSGMVQFAGQKSKRQMEKEKIHRLAKLCIQANNTSAPCLDIIRTNAIEGKFYILQESGDMTQYLKKWGK